MLAPMPDYSYENEYGRAKGRVICGVDEVGRGPLAGPVVSAAVILPPKGLPEEIEILVKDSKKLTPKKREALYPILTTHCVYALGECNIKEIDHLNILNAALLSMNRAIKALAQQPDHALIDGNKIPPGLLCKATPIIKGDDKSLSIAAASIIAKVTRDNFMKKLAEDHPHYGWEKNAGYGTKIHMQGIEKYGITAWHRRSFAPIANFKPLLTSSAVSIADHERHTKQNTQNGRSTGPEKETCCPKLLSTTAEPDSDWR